MIRNLKALGLALVAIFALSAMLASMASASRQGVLTSDGPVTLDGEEDGPNFFADPPAPGKVECPGSIVTGHRYNVTPHEAIPKTGETTVTITPHFENCKNGGSKVTVTMNGCDFVFHVGETTEKVEDGEYKLTADVICPAGKVIEVHQYLASNNENVLTCTLTVPEQKGITGFDISNDVKEGKTTETLTATGTSKNVHVITEGLCGSSTSLVAEQTINYTIKGTNATKEETGIKITDTEL